ncbi:hypothetical protein JTB14_029043 [Gonioctena quinquepunctata]|nr:hypothetical protein JTB14_029043 [Gonioctena quinquepunctata]
MEPLLLALESQPGYKIDDLTNVSSLAFADDILLLAQDVEQARRQLRVTEAYLEGLGMKLSANKCRTFRVARTKDSWYLADPGLTLSGGERVAEASDHLVYLGATFSPWTGMS